MKKKLYVARPKNLYTTAIITTMLMVIGIIDGYAQNEINKESASSTSINYISNANDLVTFNVSYYNKNEEPFILELTTDNGEVVYRKRFTDKVFNKNILIKNSGETSKINFNIRSAKENYNQSFTLNSTINYATEIVVTKI